MTMSRPPSPPDAATERGALRHLFIVEAPRNDEIARRAAKRGALRIKSSVQHFEGDRQRDLRARPA